MLYKLTNVLCQTEDDVLESDILVHVHKVSDWECWLKGRGWSTTPTTAYENSVVCKMEPYQDGLFGTFSIPVKRDYKTHDHFACYITKSAVHFIDDDCTVANLIAALCIRSEQQISTGGFLAYFIENLICSDMQYLAELEDRVEELEDTILGDSPDGFNRMMMEVRKELAEYHRYYSQLTELARSLQIYGETIFSPRALGLFRQFSERVSRLQGEVNMLREYSMQVREVYQSNIDIRQNEIMRVLTVVTAIFLPLTLLVGWYGMNFHFMPELGWKLGYPFVIALSVAIVIVCMRIFKKKKFW